MQKSLSVVGCFMSHALTEDRRASGELQRVLIHMEKEKWQGTSLPAVLSFSYILNPSSSIMSHRGALTVSTC